MKNQKITFKNNRGQQLAARIEFPEETPKSYAIFAHCFTCNKNLTAIRNIIRILNKSGIAVLSFDFTGLGESEGDFADTNFSSNVDDLIAAATFLKSNFVAPSILIGHSLGGAAVIFAAKQIPSIEALSTIGAPSNPKHVSHLLKSGIDEINAKGEAVLEIGGREFKIQKQFLNDINEQNMTKTLKELKLPLLVFHSPQDATVGIENAAQIYKAAWHPKSFISLDGATHMLTNKNDSIYVGKMIANWADRYIN
ncbi:lysophospholipase [Cellulophaga baltica]|uniref:alpha/beta hydrolase family protein n=1 Tax=Cellulophaga TaxID=104264 RepID=UPI001C07BBB0|nr:MULTISPECIES: alpha/beta fold hydrolase [Cellulophaga]MBU2997132.1 lysophospholipase [Cellulophaga baltica]MDO6768530.1 alpha/beta fold hydrolase [Cellulophaga sp. 1_MG-2023]